MSSDGTLSWEYLAGFTDGDGSIYLGKKTGISLHDFTGSRWTSYGYFSTERTLSLVNNSSTRIILNHLIPFLVVKKDAALGAIDYLNEFDFNRIKYGRNFASKLVVV